LLCFLKYRRQHLRKFDIGGDDFAHHGADQIIPCSWILDDEEVICIFNASGVDYRGGDVMVDGNLSNYKVAVIANTEEAADPKNYRGSYSFGTEVYVCWKDGEIGRASCRERV